MKILITGSKGNLGQKLMNVFDNHEVIGYDKEDLDVTNEKAVMQKITQLKPELIVNSSAYNAVDACENDKQQYELAKKINGYGPGFLAKASKKTNAILIHYSTDYVFKGDKKEGYKETDTPNPIQNYGRSKLLGEKKVQENTDKFYLIRVSKLFGQPGISDLSKKSFIDIMLELSKKQNNIKVVDEEKSCFTYTPDLAEATKKIIESKKDFGIYHLVNENPCTWYECAVLLFNKLHRKVNLDPISAEKLKRSARRPQFSALLNTKTRKLRNLEYAIKDYLKTLKLL